MVSDSKNNVTQKALRFVRDEVFPSATTSTSDFEATETPGEVQYHDQSFMILNLNDVETKARAWRLLFPRVQPYYAVKCNPNSYILEKLVSIEKTSDIRMNFDCASLGEITSLIKLGVSPDRLIYANPVKQVSYLRQAAELGVRMMTFDNGDELKKIKTHCPNAIVLLRLATDDSKSVCALSNKFGAAFDTVEPMLRRVKALELEFAGFCYHVGSGCEDANSFVQAVETAKKAFDLAIKNGLKPYILDIGGGFPGDELAIDEETGSVSLVSEPTGNLSKVITRIAPMLNAALDKFFPASEGIKIIAEPGRYMVQSCGTLFANVIARRKPEKKHKESRESEELDEVAPKLAHASDSTDYRYYISEGVYGAFNNIIYDHATVVPHVLDLNNELNHNKLHESSLWGPTCDGIDCVVKKYNLPKVRVGDWFYFENMGAYTICAASRFNGFTKSKILAIDE